MNWYLRRWTSAACGLLLASLWGCGLTAVADEPSPAAQLDPQDPESERQSFRLLPGLEVNLFAAEPWVTKPIHMTWDSRGRLWVCCSEAYPQVTPGERPNDKIVVLEDTTGDGRADKHTVFADGLYVPTGLELADGGVYVANAPELLFLKDTDGDGRADVRQVVLSGFGTEDNHHSISAWRWGPDGWLYFQEGTFLHTQVETPYGVVRLENGGVLQFRPRRRELRVFADYRASNPWGHMIDRWGQSILLDNPQIYYLTAASANSRLKPAYESMYREHTKLCGGDFVSGRHLGEKFAGEIWTNAYKTHEIYRYRLADAGAGYAVQPQEPVLTSSSDFFRPVDLKNGPDGAVYVADWFNPIIGHMQYEFRDPRRDKTRGRIWRISRTDRPLLERPELVDAPLDALLDHLRAPEDWTRNQVKRVLAERDADEVAAAIARWVQSLDPQDAEFEHHRLEALWCLQTIDRVDLDLLRTVLRSPEPRARAAAARALRYYQGQLDDALALLAAAVADEHPRVRLEGVLSLSFVPDERAVTIALTALDRPMDRFLEHGLKLAVDGLQPYWLAAHRAGRLPFARPAHEEFALSHAQSSEAVGPLIAMLGSGNIDRARLETVLPALASQATIAQLDAVWNNLTGVLAGGLPDDVTAQVLDGLRLAAERRKVRPRGNLTGVLRYATSEHPRLAVAGIRLAAVWRVPQIENRLPGIVDANALPLDVRYAAAEALAKVGGPAGRKHLETLLAAEQPLNTRYVALVGLATADLSTAADRAADVLAADPGGLDPLPVVRVFIERRGGGQRLAEALASKNIHEAVRASVWQYLSDTGLPEAELAALMRPLVPSGRRIEEQLLAEDPVALAAEALRKGHAGRGEFLFRQQSLACQKCHAIGNAGPELGPDLSSLGASSPADYIVDSVLRPSKGIKDQYQAVIVATVDGRVLTGIPAHQDNRQIVLRDAARQGELVTIAADTIEEIVPSAVSLMPENLAASLQSRQDFLDLAKFLMSLGRPGEYQVSKEPILRRWRVRRLDAANDGAPAVPVYSQTDGRLPLGEVSRLLARGDSEQPREVALTAQVDVAESGRAEVRIESRAEIMSVLLDGAPLRVSNQRAEMGLPAGIRDITITLRLPADDTATLDLRASVHPAGSRPAQLQIVSGL